MAGYKCNMTDIQASLGIHQLRKLDGFINRRTHLAQLYSEAFADVPELDIPIVHDHRKHAWHLYVIRLRTGMLRINRAQFIDELKSRNIGTSVHFIPVHLHPFYQRTFAYRMGDFPVAESIYERIVSLPLYPQMTDQDVTYVADSVLDLVKQYRK
jgi:dTDP-4-amino-4,6-dideoxygalactose transaminase